MLHTGAHCYIGTGTRALWPTCACIGRGRPVRRGGWRLGFIENDVDVVSNSNLVWAGAVKWSRGITDDSLTIGLVCCGLRSGGVGQFGWCRYQTQDFWVSDGLPEIRYSEIMRRLVMPPRREMGSGRLRRYLSVSNLLNDSMAPRAVSVPELRRRAASGLTRKRKSEHKWGQRVQFSYIVYFAR